MVALSKAVVPADAELVEAMCGDGDTVAAFADAINPAEDAGGVNGVSKKGFAINARLQSILAARDLKGFSVYPIPLPDVKKTSPSNGDGAALYFLDSVDVSLTRSVFRGNAARGAGGAVYSQHCHVPMSDVTIESNVAFSGGGIAVGTLSSVEVVASR
jgi:predicted outer membrane repeat protein